MSARAQRERDARLERERAVLQMRESVVSAIAPAYLRCVGSSGVFEAVDEALAQIVAAGDHLREPEQVKALWITYARRRVIDGQRSAEFKHRAGVAFDEAAQSTANTPSDDLSRLTDDARQWWRIREILSVLRGEQRRWAEAWYDHVLSASRARGGQPRGLPDVLGWSPAKTKSVSRRARIKMAAFIDERARGAVCAEQRALLDGFIMAGTPGHGREFDDARYHAVLFHVAGCEDCWAVWHARRRVLLGRPGGALAVSLDALAIAAQGFESKLVGLAHGVHAQASSLVGRLGIGGAAAAGGGAATLGGKTTAVCVGVVCAATAGGELAGLTTLRPIAPEPTPRLHGKTPPSKRAAVKASVPDPVARHVTRPTPPVKGPATAAPTAQVRAVVRATPPSKSFVARPTPADVSRASAASATFSATRTATPPAAAATSAAPPAAAATSAATSSSNTRCVPGSLGC